MLKTELDCSRGGGGGGGGGNDWRIICEACERAPAVFICKADAASLCVACDAEIHSANPLARRHIRLRLPVAEEEEDEAASWLLDNNNRMFLFGGSSQEEEEEEEEEYLKFVEFANEDEEFKGGAGYGAGDSVVPVPVDQLQHHNYEMYSTSPEFHSSKANYYSFNNGDLLSHHHTVPDSTTVSDMSTISTARPPKGTIDLFSGAAAATAATQLSPMDREARVLRYREKKKTRKFEKTIRYASRKAYAETRPRIKGRFAKRTDAAVHLDRTGYEIGMGIVPSF